MDIQAPNELESLSSQYANMSNQKHLDTTRGVAVADTSRLDREQPVELLEPRTNTTLEDDRTLFLGKGADSIVQKTGDLKDSGHHFEGLAISTNFEPKFEPKFDAYGALRYTKTGRICKAQKGIQGAHVCGECGKHYSRAEHLRRHQQNHEARLPCLYSSCGKIFCRQDLLDRHLATKHQQVSRSAFARNVASNHTNSRPPSIDSVRSATDEERSHSVSLPVTSFTVFPPWEPVETTRWKSELSSDSGYGSKSSMRSSESVLSSQEANMTSNNKWEALEPAAMSFKLNVHNEPKPPHSYTSSTSWTLPPTFGSAGWVASSASDIKETAKQVAKENINIWNVDGIKQEAKKEELDPPIPAPSGDRSPESDPASPQSSFRFSNHIPSMLQVPRSSSASFKSSQCSGSECSEDPSIWDGVDDECASNVTESSGQSSTMLERLRSGNPNVSEFLKTFGLTVAKDVLVQVRSILDNSGCVVNYAGSRTSSSYSQGQLGKALSSSNASTSSAGKRKGGDDDIFEAPNGNGSGDDPNKRRRHDGSSSLSPPLLRKFACPYYKRNPEKHRKWRSCSGPGWDTIHRLKEHVYRRHTIPISCARCGMHFETEEDMKKHSREPVPCIVSETEEIDGYNKEQEKQLRGRKRPPNQTEVDRWLEMYRILFPQDNPLSTPSPYYQLDEKRAQLHLVKFKEYLKDELPKKMWTDLQPDLGVFAEDQKVALETRIVDLIRDCTDHFFEACQRSFLSPPSTPCSYEEPKEQTPRLPMASFDEPSLQCHPPIQVELPSPLHTSSYFDPYEGTFETGQRLEKDKLNGWQTDTGAYQGPYDIASFTHESLQSYDISNSLGFPYQHPSMTTSHYRTQDGSPPSLFDPHSLQHELAGMEVSLDCDFSDILSSFGPMNPTLFDSDRNDLFG